MNNRRGDDHPQIEPTRRALLGGAAAALPMSALAQPAARERPIVINALGGVEDPNLAIGRPQGAPADTSSPDVDDRSVRDAHDSGLTAVNITLGYVAGDEDPYAYTLKTIRTWDRIIKDRSKDLLHVATAADILHARDSGRIGVIYGFQNAAQVGGDLNRIATFRNLGVRVIQLTYNPENQIGDGAMAPQNRGLSPFGLDVVAQLNAQRIMVDLSHSGEQTCLDAIQASSQPISINHTGCRALCDLPRNKSDAELRGVAEKGGFVGVYFMPFLTPSGHATAEDVAAHIEHAVNVCGEDHVGIGTDGDVTSIDDLDAYQSHLAEEVAGRAKAGIGAAGERADTYPFVVDLRGVRQFGKLAGLLQTRGFTQKRIDKILGLNFLAYAREVWGG